MGAAEPVVRIAEADRRPGASTPGMSREEALDTGTLWAGLVRTDAGMRSGWHHHGDFESVIFVMTGALRMESGPGGTNVVDAVPGDFLLVPRGAIHREGNPAEIRGTAIVVRSGSGVAVVNVEGPAPA